MIMCERIKWEKWHASALGVLLTSQSVSNRMLTRTKIFRYFKHEHISLLRVKKHKFIHKLTEDSCQTRTPSVALSTDQWPMTFRQHFVGAVRRSHHHRVLTSHCRFRLRTDQISVATLRNQRDLEHWNCTATKVPKNDVNKVQMAMTKSTTISFALRSTGFSFTNTPTLLSIYIIYIIQLRRYHLCSRTRSTFFCALISSWLLEAPF